MKHFLLLAVSSMLAACTAFGPPAITLSRGEIAERAFVDRRDAGRILSGLQGLAISGPDVGFQLQAQRIELAWTARLPEGTSSLPLSLRIAIAGTPVLNAARNGIDLADTRVEEISVPSVPFLSFGAKNAVRGDALGTLPLLQLRGSELNRDGVVYQPTGLTLGAFGLRVELAPK